MDGKRTLARLGLVLALVGVEVFLARDLTATGPMMGFTLTRSVSVAPQRSALVKSVAVQLGATVTAGQVIAELDTTEIDNELAAAKADRDHAIATIQAQLRLLQREGMDIERRVEWSAERATATLAIADAQSHTAAAELNAVDTEITEQKELVAKHLADTVMLNQLQLRRATLSKQVDTAAQVLGVLHNNANAASQRSSDVDATNGVESALAPLEAAVRAAELHVDQLEHERTLLSLHAPIDGVVDQLSLHAGDLAAPDKPVATIVAADTKRVVACIPEARSASVEVGFGVELTSAYAHSTGTGEVESLTNEIAPLPTRCQVPGSKAIAMGRVAVVALDAPMPGLPGETQLVRFAARRRTPHAAGPTPTTVALPVAPTTGAPIANLKVPGTLLGRTRFEASAVAWVPSLRRYLVASDDTGFKDRDNHAPWLFTMTSDGAVDPQPFVVRGVDELDDIESLAIDDQGSVWLMSSTSLSKKGKRPPSRRRLLHASLSDDGATVLGEFDLGAMLDKITQAQRTELGLPDPAQLDIEALAWHDGALFIGLKAPVDDAGRAIIWKVAHPDRLLAGDVVGAQLALWSRIKLTIQADGRTVPGGLADMMFLDAQTLVVTSTASALDPQEQASVIAVARVAEGEMTAQVVRSFPGLKAEGISVAPGGKELAVVFDRGTEPAQWVKVSLDELPHAR